MELTKNSYDRKLEMAIEQISEHYGFKLHTSETQKIVSLLREVQDPSCLEATTQIEVHNHHVNFLSYINSLLSAIAEWESKQVASNLKLCQNFLGRVITVPQNEGKLILCDELVKIFCYNQLEYCDRVVETIAKVEKSFLKVEANIKGMQLCLSCNKITKGFKGENGCFCGFCGQTLAQE
ncbi:MAG: hypothetical protein DCF19_15830 [Pseudanabaena frigida]|uniref:Uncharacterized protein n=1 Tax=Pseudanabaena frigida TaxID=945775 RepID=A0A2W4W2X5_9CYAN|nr:MAG: hypothetical protein DCF19_15830 [Pseudanabaena frigida]